MCVRRDCRSLALDAIGRTAVCGVCHGPPPPPARLSVVSEWERLAWPPCCRRDSHAALCPRLRGWCLVNYVRDGPTESCRVMRSPGRPHGASLHRSSIAAIGTVHLLGPGRWLQLGSLNAAGGLQTFASLTQPGSRSLLAVICREVVTERLPAVRCSTQCCSRRAASLADLAGLA